MRYRGEILGGLLDLLLEGKICIQSTKYRVQAPIIRKYTREYAPTRRNNDASTAEPPERLHADPAGDEVTEEDGSKPPHALEESRPLH